MKRVEINTFITIFFAKFAKSLMIISFSLPQLIFGKKNIGNTKTCLAHGFFLTIIPHGYYSLYGESIQYTGVQRAVILGIGTNKRSAPFQGFTPNGRKQRLTDEIARRIGSSCSKLKYCSFVLSLEIRKCFNCSLCSVLNCFVCSNIFFLEDFCQYM